VLERAELALFLLDDRLGLSVEDQALLAALPAGLRVLRIHNKCDLSGAPAGLLHLDTLAASSTGQPTSGIEMTALRLSAATGTGLDLLRAQLLRVAGLESGVEGQFTARARHLDALHQAALAIDRALALGQIKGGAELVAEELRGAQLALDEITGRFTSEDLLGRIFSSFCIGK